MLTFTVGVRTESHVSNQRIGKDVLRDYVFVEVDIPKFLH